MAIAAKAKQKTIAHRTLTHRPVYADTPNVKRNERKQKKKKPNGKQKKRVEKEAYGRTNKRKKTYRNAKRLVSCPTNTFSSLSMWCECVCECWLPCHAIIPFALFLRAVRSFICLSLAVVLGVWVWHTRYTNNHFSVLLFFCCRCLHAICVCVCVLMTLTPTLPTLCICFNPFLFTSGGQKLLKRARRRRLNKWYDYVFTWFIVIFSQFNVLCVFVHSFVDFFFRFLLSSVLLILPFFHGISHCALYNIFICWFVCSFRFLLFFSLLLNVVIVLVAIVACAAVSCDIFHFSFSRRKKRIKLSRSTWFGNWIGWKKIAKTRGKNAKMNFFAVKCYPVTIESGVDSLVSNLIKKMNAKIGISSSAFPETGQTLSVSLNSCFKIFTISPFLEFSRNFPHFLHTITVASDWNLIVRFRNECLPSQKKI